MWTIDRVKEELPFVQVNLNGDISNGAVFGRQLQFARVAHMKTGMVCDVAWSTIVNCLNGNRPIIF